MSKKKVKVFRKPLRAVWRFSVEFALILLSLAQGILGESAYGCCLGTGFVEKKSNEILTELI